MHRAQSDMCQWDVTDESGGRGEVGQNWNEHDQTDAMVWLNKRKKSAEPRELLGLDPVSLVIKKGRLRWLWHVEHIKMMLIGLNAK